MRRILLALMLMGCTAGFAQEPAGPLEQAAQCSNLSDSLARLTCFDKVFPAGAAAGPRPAASEGSAGATQGKQPTAPEKSTTGSGEAGGWYVTEEKSAIDDSPKVTAILAPLDGGGNVVTPTGLVVRCVENTTSVIISTENFAFGEDYGRVTTRFDSGPAETTRWEISSNGRSFGLWEGAKAIPFLKKLRDANKLAVRVVANQQSDMTFDLTGGASVVDKIAAACNWSTE